MRFRQIIQKWAIAFLALLLVEKTGGSLILHNLFHSSSATEYPLSDSKGKEINYACSCVDDFLAPFEESGVIELEVPPLAHLSHFITGGEGISAQPIFLASPRGPPTQLN